MTVSFRDIMDARHRALSDESIPITARLTEDAIDDMNADTKAVSVTDDEFLPDDDDVVGRVNALDVIEGDENVLITEDGSEYEIDP
jgi:hypothetical protein